MEYDRRWNARVPCIINVALYYGGLGLLPCQTRNISLDGMFVETGRIMLSPESPVEVVFSRPAGKTIRQQRLCAQIIRITNTGAGIMFNNIDMAAYQFLQKMITSISSRPRAVFDQPREISMI